MEGEKEEIGREGEVEEEEERERNVNHVTELGEPCFANVQSKI